MKKIIILFVVAMGLFGCEDNSSRNVVSSQVTNDNTIEISELKQKAIVPILEMSKDKKFKEFVLNECLKQEHGEYNVYFSRIIEEYKNNPSFSATILELEALATRIKILNGGIEPLLFYPKAETIEESRLNQKSSATAKLAETVCVNQDYYDNFTATSPGYILDVTGRLVYYNNITEDFAWENDVWVIGQEETGVNMSSFGDDIVSNVFSNTTIPSRSEGQAEYSGKVQVTSLSAIEPWTTGKLEFRMIIHSALGLEIKKIDFNKRKRSHFKNNKWYDYECFLGNWNTNVFGIFNVEKWMEVDAGGSSTSVTYTIPPAVPGGVSTTVSVAAHSRDMDLGTTTIQFSESIDQVYNLSHINVMRTHK